MGFEYPLVTEAIETVGPLLHEAVDYILNHSYRNDKHASTSSECSFASNAKVLGKRSLPSLYRSSQMRQSSIWEHLQSTDRHKKSRTTAIHDVTNSRSELLPVPLEDCHKPKETHTRVDCDMIRTAESPTPSHGPHSRYRPEEVEIGSDWEQKVNRLLQKQFGYSSLQNFQKEALTAWLAHQDCLVLAATGSGKSLCFQIPALLTGKVVVVVSPLISLMHDQCLKLAKRGVSACFIGSGQPDSSVEKKAMNGMFGIIYVCPETVLRLIEPLQRLAENRGIALFAIDEVHCISKWGHDFRPDYRRLSVLRENFNAGSLKFLEFDIPIMALTATATVGVRGDILESLCMSKETKVVCTSFFRPNLCFSVKHSKTSSPSSYQTDFHELIKIYSKKKTLGVGRQFTVPQDFKNSSDTSSSSTNGSTSEEGGICSSNLNHINDENFDGNCDRVYSFVKNASIAPTEKQLSVEFLEDDFDDIQTVDDLDVSYGEYYGQSTRSVDPQLRYEERQSLQQCSSEEGPTIVYVSTRRETLSIAKFLCALGVKAAAYNATLPKSHLRRVHQEFHENTIDVVVATIAFGMGIDKPNVRRIIHYGWPQSLESYYQEAGRAGRDGKPADCILYANQLMTPTLLPSRRSEEQMKQAYKMLSDCFRYGMNTSHCRAKLLVVHFGEEFTYGNCMLCDVCLNGPSKQQNLKVEAAIFMRVVAAHSLQHSSCDDFLCNDRNREKSIEKPNIRMIVAMIRERSQDCLAVDWIWWRGFARILEDKGLIREGIDFRRVQIKCPVITEKGLRYLETDTDQDLWVNPEADMLLSSTLDQKPYSSFSEWGKGWADPKIRRWRLEGRRSRRKARRRRSSRLKTDMKTVRGRLAAKILKQK
ncbi:hypothetical protein Nepgr_013202 [Nepenthes gracilis]|uniref:ATP-dependent DNA helicase n=1 Tax=Nepenthes gracilis TaxID=150966 RepID=A0AAD3SII9_NEPGR|nr:hypothetical protein Nepgr_013202 [Nepenthes gracilis]